MVHFEELVGQFEGKLGRNLCSKERDLVSWMADQHSRKKQFKKNEHKKRRDTLLL